jgi:hypothetical protein
MERATTPSSSRRAIAVIVAVCALCALALPSVAGAKAKPRNKTMSDYERAVKLLDSPDTWCKGAETLARIGDPKALVPLVRAWWSRHEGGKGCLTDAMEELGAEKQARALFESKDGEERDVGLELMSLFSSDDHLAPLEKAALGHDELSVRAASLRVLLGLKRTPEWEKTMIRLLDAPYLAARVTAVEGLERRKGDAVKNALRARLAKETNDALKKRISAALNP